MFNINQPIHDETAVSSIALSEIGTNETINLVATQLASIVEIGAHISALSSNNTNATAVKTQSNEALPTPISLGTTQTASKNRSNNDQINQLIFNWKHEIEMLFAKLEEMKKGNGYASWWIIEQIIGKLNSYATELRQDVIDPLRKLQAIDRAHSKLEAIINKMQAKAARNETITDEDSQEFADAVKEVERTVNEALEKLPKRAEGQEPTPYEDLILRLKANIDMILKEPIINRVNVNGNDVDIPTGKTIGDSLDDPKSLTESLRRWSSFANGSPPKGPFATWSEGKIGFTTLRLEMTSMVSEHSERLNRDTQLLTSLNSMAQKMIELDTAFRKTATSNQRSQ